MLAVRYLNVHRTKNSVGELLHTGKWCPSVVLCAHEQGWGTEFAWCFALVWLPPQYLDIGFKACSAKILHVFGINPGDGYFRSLCDAVRSRLRILLSENA